MFINTLSKPILIPNRWWKRMPRPRNELVCTEDTPFYHVTSRCVRRSFLCGFDPFNGQSYEHRREWIEERIRLLSSLFSIDICAYAIMSNHFHIVLKINIQENQDWTDTEVCERWTSIFKGAPIIQNLLKGHILNSKDKIQAKKYISLYRQRLGCLSWFMKCLNEPIARRANKEDSCTGHFWEGRFKSQALLTQKALLSCMAYVDLNPVRALQADTPESSNHTSIKERLKPCFTANRAKQTAITAHQFNSFEVALKPLYPFDQGNNDDCIPLEFSDYLELIDYTGRQVRQNKRGVIPVSKPPILERLNLTQRRWLEITTRFEKIYRRPLVNTI